jgi:hypothetical protein
LMSWLDANWVLGRLNLELYPRDSFDDYSLCEKTRKKIFDL